MRDMNGTILIPTDVVQYHNEEALVVCQAPTSPDMMLIKRISGRKLSGWVRCEYTTFVRNTA